ncbi:helix-turn-helix transcriptional regulator [Haloarchaeobius sp. TZWSO28]|uniref:helix-turn-helix transcriptional regulator n=1 Tax=Haloarchaeobius sp. TZWSO28 TaxID=3446119 RepID=UPI003EC0462E
MGKVGDSELLQHLLDKHSLLRAIADEPAADLSTLTAKTGYSKSTVNRTLNELDDHGVLRTDDSKKPHTYSLTFFGRQLLSWVEEGHAHQRYQSLYDAIPADATLPSFVLTEGSVEVATDSTIARHQVFDQILEFVSRVDRFHVVVPNLTRDGTFLHFATEVIENDLSVELVVPDQFFEFLWERFGDEMATMFRERDATAYSIPTNDIPYGFGLGYIEDEDGTIVDAEVAVVCYDEHYHNANGTVVTKSPQAVAWAEARYDRYRARATERTGDFLAENRDA